jgi:ribonuclease P protein component
VDKVLGRSWLGAMVPKRHARRAVTRNLLKRQIRAAFERHEAALPHGMWLVRLRRVFPPSEFVSARSALLAEAATDRLEVLDSERRNGAFETYEVLVIAPVIPDEIQMELRKGRIVVGNPKTRDAFIASRNLSQTATESVSASTPKPMPRSSASPCRHSAQSER